MRFSRSAGGLLALPALLLLPMRAAHADQGGTLGGLVSSAGVNLAGPLMLFLVATAYLVGFWLVISGLMSLKAASEDNGRTSYVDGLARIIGGAFLAGLPDTVNAGLVTLFQQSLGYQGSFNRNAPGAVRDCLGSTNGGALTCAAENVGTNLVPVGIEFIFILFCVVGVFIIFQALLALATSQSQGQRQEIGKNIWRIVLGVMCCQVPFLMSSVQSTLGITNGVISASGAAVGGSSPPSMLSYTAPANMAVLTQWSALISWGFVILAFFGVISVARGILQIRSTIEGTGRDGVVSGIVHIVGGVMLANAKVSTCFILSTLLGNGVGFCS